MKYISIGEWCISSYILKKMSLKESSYPFDWIFSNQYMLKDVIENNNIFTVDNYKGIDNKTFHKKYGLIFNHHNPYYNIKDYEYFIRRFTSWKNIDKNEEIIFIYVIHEMTIEKINFVCDLLDEKFTSYKVLVFFPNDTDIKLEIKKAHIYGIKTKELWMSDNWNLHNNNGIQKIIDIIKK